MVIGGFSVDSASVPALSRRISGAEARIFPVRGQPARCEIKAAQTIWPNRWNRERNRSLVFEVVRIL